MFTEFYKKCNGLKSLNSTFKAYILHSYLDLKRCIVLNNFTVNCQRLEDIEEQVNMAPIKLKMTICIKINVNI